MSPINPLTNLLALLFLPVVCLAQARPAPGDNRIAKLYDIGDLVTEVEGVRGGPFEAPRLGIPGTDQIETAIGAEAIAQLLRAFMKPKLRSSEEVNPVGERWIVALGRPEQHAWITRFLEAARGSETQPVLIDCTCFTVPEITFLRDIRPALIEPPEPSDAADADPTEPAAEEPNYLTRVLAPGARTNAFLRELVKNTEVEVITTQKLHVLPLRTAHMATVNQTAYIRDFDLKVAKDAIIADPIVDVVQDGVVLEVAVSLLENGRLGVSIDAIVTDLQRPIPRVETKLPGIELPVTIQLPSLKSTQIEAAVELEANHVVVMAPPPLAGKRILFVVTVVPQEAPKPKGAKKVYKR